MLNSWNGGGGGGGAGFYTHLQLLLTVCSVHVGTVGRTRPESTVQRRQVRDTGRLCLRDSNAIRVLQNWEGGEGGGGSVYLPAAVIDCLLSSCGNNGQEPAREYRPETISHTQVNFV